MKKLELTTPETLIIPHNVEENIENHMKVLYQNLHFVQTKEFSNFSKDKTSLSEDNAKNLYEQTVDRLIQDIQEKHKVVSKKLNKKKEFQAYSQTIQDTLNNLYSGEINYAQLELVYKQLKENYEDAKEFKTIKQKIGRALTSTIKYLGVGATLGAGMTEAVVYTAYDEHITDSVKRVTLGDDVVDTEKETDEQNPIQQVHPTQIELNDTNKTQLKEGMEISFKKDPEIILLKISDTQYQSLDATQQPITLPNKLTIPSNLIKHTDYKNKDGKNIYFLPVQLPSGLNVLVSMEPNNIEKKDTFEEIQQIENLADRLNALTALFMIDNPANEAEVASAIRITRLQKEKVFNPNTNITDQELKDALQKMNSIQINEIEGKGLAQGQLQIIAQSNIKTIIFPGALLINNSKIFSQYKGNIIFSSDEIAANRFDNFETKIIHLPSDVITGGLGQFIGYKGEIKFKGKRALTETNYNNLMQMEAKKIHLHLDPSTSAPGVIDFLREDKRFVISTAL